MKNAFAKGLYKTAAWLALPLALAGCYYEPGYYTRGDAYYGTPTYYEGYNGYYDYYGSGYYGPGYYGYGPGHGYYGPSFGLGWYYHDRDHSHRDPPRHDRPSGGGWGPVDGRRPDAGSRPLPRGNGVTASGPRRSASAPMSRGSTTASPPPMRSSMPSPRGSAAPSRSSPSPRSSTPRSVPQDRR